ncbi:hypothetical protein TNCV_3665581 [Trichonephila clavipes]|nr:hypothetical protein TNCV_3665581 [Trichonephila clavipes]
MPELWVTLESSLETGGMSIPRGGSEKAQCVPKCAFNAINSFQEPVTITRIPVSRRPRTTPSKMISA